MQRLMTLTALALAVPALASAHVGVRPRESKVGAEEKYTVRVPTEGKIATTFVELEVPAGVTVLEVMKPEAATFDTQAPAASDEAARIEAWLAGYDAAFNAKDLDRLAAFDDVDVTIYEGGGVNNGWADYRDRHLGPELKGFQNLQFGHTGRKVHVLGDGRTAYAISQYSLKARMGERDVDSGGLETLVLIKGDDGAWKIRHSHTSSRARRPPQTPDPAR